jgi:hypothetical protein
MATGRLPFTGASTGETVTNILEKEAAPLTELSPDRPKKLERIVSTLLRKRADARYQSARELQRDLAPLTEPARLRRVFGRLRRS